MKVFSKLSPNIIDQTIFSPSRRRGVPLNTSYLVHSHINTKTNFFPQTLRLIPKFRTPPDLKSNEKKNKNFQFQSGLEEERVKGRERERVRERERERVREREREREESERS